MASAVLRSRVWGLLSLHRTPNRRFLSSDAASMPAAAAGQHHNNADKEFLSSSSKPVIREEAIAAATASAQAAAAAAEASGAEAAALQKKGGWQFLKYGIFGSLFGAAGLAGYVTYAYTLDEVDQKTKPLREAATAAAAAAAGGDHASAMEKYRGLLYSTAISVPAKAVELYLDSRGQVEEYFRRISDPISDKLLPDMHPQDPRFTLVLDLNETLIYSDWKRERGWRTFKRPGVDAFLQQLAPYYEIVVYTDHLYMFAQPVVERLAQSSPNTISHMLSRDDTKYKDGKHYRDFSKLNRDPNKIIYLSAHGLENSLQREYCLQISPFKLDDKGNAPLDTTLLDLLPFLEYVGRHPPADMRTVLQSYQGKDVAKEFRERSKEFQRRKQEQRHQQQQQQQGWFWRR